MTLNQRFQAFRHRTRRLTVLAGMLLVLSSPVLAGSWQQNQTLGGFNNVHVYTPDSFSPVGDGPALLVVLLVCAQSINAFLSANLEDAAEAHGMVIAVPDARNKAGFSCWSYWQVAIARNAGDYANLVDRLFKPGMS